MKGQGRPIWIMVTLLLAMVVGITMYQIIQKTQSQKTFEDMMKEINVGTADVQLHDICERWRSNGYVAGVSTDDLEKASAYAVVLGYFTEEEFNMGERISPCDCSIYLFSKGYISRLDAEKEYDPDECHQKANEIADAKGLY